MWSDGILLSFQGRILYLIILAMDATNSQHPVWIGSQCYCITLLSSIRRQWCQTPFKVFIKSKQSVLITSPPRSPPFPLHLSSWAASWTLVLPDKQIHLPHHIRPFLPPLDMAGSEKVEVWHHWIKIYCCVVEDDVSGAGVPVNVILDQNWNTLQKQRGK